MNLGFAVHLMRLKFVAPLMPTSVEQPTEFTRSSSTATAQQLIVEGGRRHEEGMAKGRAISTDEWPAFSEPTSGSEVLLMLGPLTGRCNRKPVTVLSVAGILFCRVQLLEDATPEAVVRFTAGETRFQGTPRNGGRCV